MMGLATAVGCRSAPRDVHLWIVEPSAGTSVRGISLPDAAAGDIQPASISLAGAINETLSFRFAVRAGSERIDSPTLRVMPLRSVGATMDPTVVQLFRMQRVAVRSFPGWHVRSVPPSRRVRDPWDVLVPIGAPRGGLPDTINPHETLLFWADVRIPKGTFDGRYSGRIALVVGGLEAVGVDLDLTVRPLVLPDEGDVRIIAELDHRQLFSHHIRRNGRPLAMATDDWRIVPESARLNELLAHTMRELRRHRLTPVLSELVPLVRVDTRGRVEVDWGQYDSIVAPCMDGTSFHDRVPLTAWPLPLGVVAAGLATPASPMSAGYENLVHRYLAACVRHFDERGWLDRSYALLPTDVRDPTPAMDELRSFAELAAGIDERINVASSLPPQNLAPFGWTDYPEPNFGAAVRIWTPRAQFFDPVVMAEQRRAGRRTWFRADRPPYSGTTVIQASPADVRVLGWQAARLGAEVIRLGEINHWPDAATSPTPENCITYDTNVLLYPGAPYGLYEPVASVRLKYLRESLQDAAYRTLLREHGLEHVVVALTRALSAHPGSDAYRTHFADGRRNGWIDDPYVFDVARRIMADSLIAKLTPDTSHRSAPGFAGTADWRRLMLATERVELHPDGTRIRLHGPATKLTAELEFAMTIMNRTRKPLAGSLRLSNARPEWTVPPEPSDVATIPPYESRRAVRSVETTGFPTAAQGILNVPVELLTENGERHTGAARVACVTAARLNGTLRIDGDLSDWPAGNVNVMGRFALISALPEGDANDPDNTPRHATFAFVLRDDTHLYVAINSECNGRQVSTGSRQNRVSYDDLVPVGDELVELLIDPLNGGTRSPSDLYHIVVKPSGSYRLEKGIAVDPPCGRHEPWPVDIEIATRVTSERWTAELRIPLASFGAAMTSGTVWGFNVTRYDAPNQEFSTWSGALGNAYDPLSLGNLYLP